MANQAKEDRQREETKKQERRRRRDEERNRRVLIGIGIAVGLILLILLAGVVQELVLKPMQPVATVNGNNISSQDFAKYVKFNWLQQGPPQDAASSSQQVLDTMVDQELIRELAKQRGITVSQAELDNALGESFGYYATPPTPAPTQPPLPTSTPDPKATPGPTATPAPTSTPVSLEAYKSAYATRLAGWNKQAGMTDADVRKLVELQLLQTKLYDSVTADVPTTEEEVHAQHILIRTVPEPPTPTPLPTGQPAPSATPQPTPGGPTPAPTAAPRNDQQALARAQEVEQKLKAGGAFAQLAKEYSDDPGSAAKGGDLGWFGKGQMVPEFETAAFTQTVGTVGPPVKTTYGYHIIQVLEKDPNHPMDQSTLSQKKSQAYQQWLDGQRTAAKIQKNWTADKVPPTPVGVSQ